MGKRSQGSHTFPTRAEAVAFADGVNLVNDAAIAAWLEGPTSRTVIVQDEDAENNREVTRRLRRSISADHSPKLTPPQWTKEAR